MKHQLLERVAERHHLVERDAAPVAAVVAVAAAGALEALRTCRPPRAGCRRRSAPAPSRPTGFLQSGQSLRTRRWARIRFTAAVTRNGSTPMFSRRRDRAGRVVGVQGGEHQVAGERRLDADLRGLEVADLADHDDVGVLPQEASAGAAAKLSPISSCICTWLMPAKLYSTGSSAVQMFSLIVVELGERRVERRGLARARGPGDQHHAVRPVDGLHEPVELRLLEAELGHVQLQVRLVEEAQDHLLAEERRAARRRGSPSPCPCRA